MDPNGGTNNPGQAQIVIIDQSHGAFTPPTTALQTSLPATSVAQGYGAIAAGDVDGNGSVDLVIASDATVQVFLNKGQGTFSAQTSLTTSGSATDSLLLADFDNDGNLDIAVGDNENPQIGIFYGKGQGAFGSETMYALSAPPIPLGLVLAPNLGSSSLPGLVSAAAGSSPSLDALVDRCN